MRGWVSKTIAKKPSGVTSLLLVLAIGVVLTIMVGGIAALTVREQQQASNTEFSKRALQTAEAGIESAVQKLSKDPNYQKIGCAVDSSDAVFGNVVADPAQQVTCAEVKSKLNDYEGSLERDRTTTFFFNTGECDTNNANCINVAPDTIRLRWNSNKLDVQGDVFCKSASECEYPKYEDGNKLAASIELNFVYWPKNNPKQMSTATVFVVPGQNDKGYSASGNRTAVETKCQNQPGVNNTASFGDYKCVTSNSSNGFSFRDSILKGTGVDINGDYTFALRITPRYNSTHYQLQAYKGNTEVLFQSSKAMIDITAKVGNLYRRVKAEKLIGPGAVEGVFDSVLYSGKGLDDQGSRNICKNQIVLSDGSPAPGSPPCI